MMHRRLFTLLALLATVCSVSVGAFLWYRQKSVAANKVVAPFSTPDLLVSFSNQLESFGISQEAPPTILGDTITASISGIRVLFDKSQSWETQIRTLQVVLPQFKMDQKKYHEIDLRFSKVIFR